ncbi:SUN domaincontaining protein 1like [Caligus rogercresseyi]|uniref:SUN domaincontaining protein 1like n=1 Tax=Caligus rogercresseyi TaxID=217165 RepID=A0A7T8K7Y3_CALRO|nr:SUN domaincontaining protein 1like [Caligus rogercresseyi]
MAEISVGIHPTKIHQAERILRSKMVYLAEAEIKMPLRSSRSRNSSDLNIWRTCGNRSSSSHGDGLLQRIGRSIYSVLRNSCLFIGSLCICASLPFIHVGKKVISLFSSRDEVDELHLEELMDGNDECIDEGFDSLSDEDFDEKVLQRNMKFFESSELLSTQSSKIDGKQKVGSCSKCVPLLLLFLLLVPLCLYGLLPTLHSSDGSLPVPLDWISIKSVDYLDTAKGLQNRAQEGGKTLLSYAQNEYNGISSSVSFKFSQLKDALSRSGSSLSVGLSGFEGSLRQYFSSFFNILCGFCTNLKNGLMNACTSSYECLRSFLAWIGDNALFCYKRTIGIIFLGKEKTSFFISNAWQSIGNKLFGLSLLFNKKRSEESLSSDPIEPSRQETTQHAPKKTTQENVSKPKVLSSTDYDIIVDKIISSEKFQELSHSKSLSEDDNVVIQSSKNEILKLVNDQEEKLQKEYSELKDILLQQKETLDSHQESYDLWKKDIENVFQSLKLEIQGLSTQDSSNSDGLLKELSDKIHALEENSQKLFNLSTSCCDSIKSLNVEDRVKGYFQGAKGDELIGQMKEQFITKEDNSDRLAKLKVEVLEQLKKLQSSASGSTTLEVDSIHRVVQEALIRYDADKTGKFDYALESAGGSVISTRCTETYVKKTALYTLLGLPLWYPSNNPRTAIQPGVHPGECWAFKGSEGFLVIHLSNAIVPKSFSIEHIPKSMSPSGSIDSAPKDFIVLGLKSEKDPNPAHLGKYSYSHTGDPLQSFDITDPVQESFDVIELNILSNHGNVNFTCLYRFRVHGSPIHD